MAARSKCVLVLSFLNAVVFTTQKSIHANTRIHHHMNVDDLREVFQVERHSDVPDYEIVHFHSIRKREASSPSEAPSPSPSPSPSSATDDNRVEEDNETGRELAERLLKLEAFGRSHELSLQPLDQQLFKGNLKMWSAESDGNGSISYTELPDTYVGDPYQDEENQAALLLHEDRNDGSLLMEGTIGHDLVIKPLPAHLRKQMERMQTKVDKKKMTDELEGSSSDGDEMFMDREMKLGQDQIAKNGFPLGKEEEERRRNKNKKNDGGGGGGHDDDQQNETTFHPHHVVFRRQSHVNDDLKFSDFAYMEAGDFYKNKATKTRRKRSIVKREAPYIIYPEILVIVDYDGYRLHGGDNVQVKRYFVSFWNGVDLRYKLLKGPKVRISIAGLIISRGRDATPYLERNRVGRDAVDSAAALTDMGKYLFRERRLPVYDIAVAVTKYDMCRRRKGGRCTKGTAGFAYVGGACVVNKRLEKVNSVAIIEDTGGFSGIIVAAHEVGHLLGAVHDGSPPPTYLGGPGAEKCRWEDGFIMSDLRHSEKGFKWSACSVSSFHHFLNGDTATCLYNSPHEDESLPRVLPGKLLTLDAQCRRDRGTSACFKDERVCSQLFCFDSGSGYCVAYRPAAEGSPCGDGQTCSNGICIAEHENIIPDYSQNTPAYLRRSDEDLYARALYGNSTRRSEWEEFWRTVTTVRTPSLAVGSYLAQNGYEQQPPSTTPSYNAYQSIFQSLAPGHQAKSGGLDPFAFYTTKGALNETPLLKSYKFPSKTYSTSAKKSNKSPPPPSVAYHGDVSTTRYRYNDFLYSSLYPKSYVQSSSENDECVDKAFELPGAVSCYDYLTKYGLQYCADEYFKRNCCAAIKYVCNNYQPL